MACSDLEPPREYAQLCHDLALVAPNGSASDQQLVHTSFVFQNDRAAYAESQPASLAGLDGAFRLTRGHTVLADDDAPVLRAASSPPRSDRPLLLFEVAALEQAAHAQIDLDAFDPELWRSTTAAPARWWSAPGAPLPVRRPPTRRASGSRSAAPSLYEYGSDVLERRRRVVEAGENCSAHIEELRTSATSTTPTAAWGSARAR